MVKSYSRNSMLGNAYSNKDNTSSKHSFNMHTSKQKTQKKHGSKLHSKDKPDIPTSTLVLPLKHKPRVPPAPSVSQKQLSMKPPKMGKQSKGVENQELLKIILDETKANKKY
jgi:hypothetical protein